MYLRGKEEVPCPDDTAGLHIRARDNQVVKATIGPDELAFQVHLSQEAVRRLHGCFRHLTKLFASVRGNNSSNACRRWPSSRGLICAGRRVNADPLGRAPAGDAALCAQRLVTSGRRRQPQHLCGLYAAQVQAPDKGEMLVGAHETHVGQLMGCESRSHGPVLRACTADAGRYRWLLSNMTLALQVG